jgi:predicted transcriptional regulator of viral defense system
MERHLKYILDLQNTGQLLFTKSQMAKDLSLSEDAVRNGLYRLKKQGMIINPIKSVYVIVPPEYRSYGSIPAADLIPLLMEYWQLDYYVACLSAGIYHGATHQKPGSFQVITNKRIKGAKVFGRVSIDFIYKKNLLGLVTQNIMVNTGYLKVATPEVTALDLFLYPRKCGGLNHIATVLSELVEAIDPNKLIQLAERIGQSFWLQRMGYILENIEPDDEQQAELVVTKIHDYLKGKKLKFIALAPELPIQGHHYNSRWKIIENTEVESDL